jgi:kynurenine formamidase
VRIVDLSHALRPGHWRWQPRLSHRITHADPGAVFQSGLLETPLHAYTHVDAPVHFLPDGASLDRLPIDTWVGEGTVADLSDLRVENGGVRAEHLEARAGHVRPGDIVLLRSDWDQRADIETREFWTTGPFTCRDAAEWLAERGVKAVGYDYAADETLRLDPEHPNRFGREEHTTHAVFFPRGIGVIEYLANLRAIRAERFLFVALPLKVLGGDGSPVRAVAIEYAQNE